MYLIPAGGILNFSAYCLVPPQAAIDHEPSWIAQLEENGSHFSSEAPSEKDHNPLSIQIKKLRDAGYIEVKKTFKNNYPNTSLSITIKGIEAFENYVINLKKYINPR